MDVVLVAGLWLDASVWDEVVVALEERGLRSVAVGLPGQGDGDASATLADQVAAVVAAVDAAEGPAVVVGHSAACALAWAAADARPTEVARVVVIGGFPVADGEAYADFFPVRDGVMPFPGWEPFAGPDSADLDEAARDAFTAAALPVPEGVSRGVVRLADPARYRVPVTLVCPEFTPEQARESVEAGDLPELARVEHLSYVDLDSGHWPMITVPRELAGVLVEAAHP